MALPTNWTVLSYQTIISFSEPTVLLEFFNKKTENFLVEIITMLKKR